MVIILLRRRLTTTMTMNSPLSSYSYLIVLLEFDESSAFVTPGMYDFQFHDIGECLS